MIPLVRTTAAIITGIVQVTILRIKIAFIQLVIIIMMMIFLIGLLDLLSLEFILFLSVLVFAFKQEEMHKTVK